MTADEAFRRAAAALEGGDRDAAERLAGEALAADPDHADAHALLGHVRVRAGDRAAALPHWRRAAELRPAVAAAHYNLAELLRQLGDPAAAEREFRAALELAPRWEEAHFGLANVLRDRGRPDEALAAYARAIELRPGFARALYNRANLLREEGRVAPAERDYRAALAADPGLTDAAVNLGAALGELHRWAEAEACYRHALARRPDDRDLAASLAGAVRAQGRTDEAARLMETGAARDPDPAAARLRREALLPPIPSGREAIAADRARLRDALDRARSDPPRLAPSRLHQSGLEPPMALAYHAEDPRPLLEGFAALYAPRIEPLEPLPPAGGRPRVGVVVTHGHEGVYDRCLGRLVERVAAAGRVSVALVCSRSGANVLRHLRPTFLGDYLVLPARIDEAAAAVRDARFDVLHYWEIGTDATNYFLPFFRPARVQCATWGWPVTSGNPRVDWFVSAAPLEPPDGDAHYTERLVRLDALPTCYERPPAPPAPPDPAARRRAFGVDAGTAVYLCVQNLRKLHPDFDGVLARVLAGDPRGRVVLVGDEQPAVTAALMDRLRRALGPDVGRVGVVPRQERDRYLRLVGCADVVLDTPHYGSGANTVADAVACGTPQVTRPGRYHRGRWAGAVLTRAGLGELVADSADGYAAAAVRAARDETFRRGVAERLRDFGAGWFDDPRPAHELETFWLRESRSGPASVGASAAPPATDTSEPPACEPTSLRSEPTLTAASGSVAPVSAPADGSVKRGANGAAAPPGPTRPGPAVLLVAHALPPLEHSGTPAIAHAYARRLTARGVRVGVLYATTRPGAPPLRAYRDEQYDFARYEVPATPHLWHLWSIRDAATQPPRLEALHAVLDAFRPDLAHVVDQVNLPGEWVEGIKARGVPVLRHVCNAEDLCGMIEPMGPVPGSTCPAPITPRQCAECCFRELGPLRRLTDALSTVQPTENPEHLRERGVAEYERLLAVKCRKVEDAFARLYDRIVFPTRSFREFFERTLPLPPERTVIVEHGIDLDVDRGAAPLPVEGLVRFLFLGNLIAKKGIDDLIAAFTHPDLLGRDDYDLTIRGGGNAAVLRDPLAANPRVRYTGSYTPEQLPAILSAAHVGLSPSRFETFHRVTREYLAAGLPVIGSTAFGIPDAIRDGVNGLIFNAGDATGLRRAVAAVLEDRERLGRLRAGARQASVRSAEDEVDELLEQYALATAAHAGAGW